jgi:peptide/nickel transport system permease protein
VIYSRPPAGLSISAALLAGWILLSLTGPLLAPYPSGSIHLDARLQGPSARFPLGTDDLGRDVLSRLLVGSRVSLAVAVASLLLSALLGAPAGLLAGYLGGAADSVACRVMDILMAIPGVLLAISIVAFVGKGFTPLVVALSVTGWVGYARLARVSAMGLRTREFVSASVSLGAGTPRIVLCHIFPNTAGLLAVQSAAGAAGIILSEASLSFLGLGVQPPHPSWGEMLASGCDTLLEAPHLALIPGVCLFAVVWALYAFGEGLSARLDPQRNPRADSL